LFKRIVAIDFKIKRGEAIAKKMGKRRKGAGRKKEKMPRVEFDMEAIKEIKKRRKRSQKRR
jgi:hypothetical protein